ncbi:MAG: HAD family hydrolase [Candidatus Omnitrophica bacterium]|nr:HAD family hydrolase [Candidatus Omnitrophota bacterium]
MKKKSLGDGKAVFLDRDGVINEILFFEDAGVLETPFHPRHFRLLPKAARAIRKLNKAGFPVFVVSNQPGVGMGHFSLRTLAAIDAKMKAMLARKGARLDGIFYCFHHPQKGKGKYKKICLCRKPKSGLLDQAAKAHRVDLKKSYLVGDSIFDIQAGLGRGLTTILLGRHKCDVCALLARKGIKPHEVAGDLYEAVDLILAHLSPPRRRGSSDFAVSIIKKSLDSRFRGNDKQTE